MRSWKRFTVHLTAILLLFAANHVEYHFRGRAIQKVAKAEPSAVFVRKEDSLAGHNSIGIAENKLPDGTDQPFLRFATLGDWDFDSQAPTTPCPDSVESLSGKDTTMVGFMYPLEAGEKLKTFCLLRSTQTCCYGPKPQYNQYVLVEMPQAVKFERLMPVIVEGKFIVDPKPEEGYIYRMEATAVRPAAAEDPEVDGKEAAQKAHLPLFDFALLEDMRPASDQAAASSSPAQLSQLDGQQVVVEGYFLSETKETPPRIRVGKEWWDGVSKGVPPNLYNAVMVTPKNQEEVPSRWKQKVVFTGVLHVTPDRDAWKTRGIVSIEEAVKGVPGQGGSRVVLAGGAFLSVGEEIAIFIAFLGLSFWRVFSGNRGSTTNGHQSTRI